MSTEHLSDQQIGRIEALQAAAPLVGRKTEGVFKGVEPVEITDLVDLAEYILKGDHPMDRFSDTLRTVSGERIGPRPVRDTMDIGKVGTDDDPDA